jgi:hypothetical protein
MEARWDRLEAAVRFALGSGDPDFLVNRVVYVSGANAFETHDMPHP